jgi:hypothetical protein
MKKKPTKVKEEVIVNNSDKHQEELTDRLKHYNDWLMDNSRPCDSTYPGYPADKKKKSAVKVAPINNVKGKTMKIQAVGVKVTGVKLMKRAKEGTKQFKAYEIVQKLGTVDKSVAIQAIMGELNMSKAGATTYFHNAKNYLASQTTKEAV